jgi:hypothetical protein
MLILFSNGYGKLVVEASINSSTGCSSVTDWTREMFSEEREGP